MRVELDEGQLKAISELTNGKILNGGVGSGKSRASLAYFFTKIAGGDISEDGEVQRPVGGNLLIITTAKKRDSLEWEDDMVPFGMSTATDAGWPEISVTIDSWNNIGKYLEIKDHFVIFDEQRLVGSGAWVKSFYKIAERNKWILLSATPGDTWSDYIPVFVANGFYKNKTDFSRQHIVWKPYMKFPSIDRYVGTKRLERHRESLLVDMPYERKTKRIRTRVHVSYDKEKFLGVWKSRWNPYTDEPIQEISELGHTIRRVVNEDPSRILELANLLTIKPRIIVFYNFNYELDILREFCEEAKIPYAEWNGHKHQQIPDTERWVYLVQYTSGAEGWNCTSTDTMVFYSLNYSWRVMHQAEGRIDRRNTKYDELFYYVFRSTSGIDNAIWKALSSKKDFNERKYLTDKG